MDDDAEAKAVVQKLGAMKFFFTRVKSAPVVGTFTSLQTTIQYEDHYLSKESVSSFFDINKAILTGETADSEKKAALSRLENVLGDKKIERELILGLQREKYEREQFLYISTYLLRPLAGQCVLNNHEYTQEKLLQFGRDHHLADVPVRGAMGMGSKDTWRGAPDAQCNIQPAGTQTLTQTSAKASAKGSDDQFQGTTTSGTKALDTKSKKGKRTDKQVEETSSDADDRQTRHIKKNIRALTTVEAKACEIRHQEMNQTVGHAVVASFTIGCQFPEMNPLVPAIVINGHGFFAAALYDYKKDVLIHFKKQAYLYFDENKKGYCKSGVVLLWLLLHHRLFLKQLTPTEGLESGLKKQFQERRALEGYEQLEKMDLNFSDFSHSDSGYPDDPVLSEQ